MNRLAFLGMLVVTLNVGGCAVPRHTVLFYSADQYAPTDNVEPIPACWNGRCIRVGQNPIAFGGQAEHVHALAHRHSAESSISADVVRPLGNQHDVVAGATHNHLVESITTDAGATGVSGHLTPSTSLTAVVVASPLRRVPARTIVAYVGDGIPEGWVLCDGTQQAPDLQERFVVLRSNQSSPVTLGSASHNHNAEHEHTWTARSSTDERQQGYANRPNAPQADPAGFLSVFRHRSHAIEPTASQSRTHHEPILPPSMTVRFIMSVTEQRRMPAGTLLPCTRRTLALGWSNFKAIGEVEAFGRMLIGSERTQSVGQALGQQFHTHCWDHTHAVTVTAIDHEDDPNYWPGQGPPVTVRGHSHRAEPGLDQPTGPAEHTPLYVQMSFIIKN